MSSSRYPENRYQPRERSPYRDRRASGYGGYPPRGNESTRSHADGGGFAARDVPRGPKSLVDTPRAPGSGPPSGVPSGPRDDRGRGYLGRGDGPLLRDAPPLTNTRDARGPRNDLWRAADRDRDRDFDRRTDRRASPPRRSPARDSRDSRDFPPRDLDISRARRNSRDGPPSAGSNYSDPPPLSAQSYRGSGIGRGRGGRDVAPDIRRGRPYHTDDRDRNYDVRDRLPDRREQTYRPRSRSREARDGPRRERDPIIRDDRDYDRRDRDDRRFDRRDEERRGYDSYKGPASLGVTARGVDTRHSNVPNDSRHAAGTSTNPPTPHPLSAASSHPFPADRLGPPEDAFSRRSSVATEPLSAKDARRESDKNELLASRAEASRERYASRDSSPPPAAVPAFGSSNVWRNPALDTKPIAAPQVSKPIKPPPPMPSANPPAPPTPSAVSAVASTGPPVTLAASAAPANPRPQPAIPAGLSTVPPTGPKADRPAADNQSQETRPPASEQARVESVPRPPPFTSQASASSTEKVERRPAVQSLANSPPLGLGPKPRAPPTHQAGFRPNVSPSQGFGRPPQAPFSTRDASPSAIPLGPRNSMQIATSPKSIPGSIPTGPKADRAPSLGSRPFSAPDRPPFQTQRPPVSKNLQWTRPGLIPNRPSLIPNKRDFVADDRDRTYGTVPKAPRLDGSVSAPEPRQAEAPKPPASLGAQEKTEAAATNTRASSVPFTKSPPGVAKIDTRRLSDISMRDASPQVKKPPNSADSSAPEVMEDSDDEDLELGEADFQESEAKYNREKALLQSRLIDVSASKYVATDALRELSLLCSITVDHLPRQPTKDVETVVASPKLVEPVLPVEPTPAKPAQPLELPEAVEPAAAPALESPTAELPTPKAEEAEEMNDEVMEDHSRSPSPALATRALRPKRGYAVEREPTPDFSLLPYLPDGPPTPLSDPDQEPSALNPPVPESTLAAIQDNLKVENAPEVDPDAVLADYMAAYKKWRRYIRSLDYELKKDDDQERPGSVEPHAIVATQELPVSASAAMMDIPPPTTGRRGHSSRWATELDIEQVIKESLKTAEEERMGKKDSEPRKSNSDPEREADVPLELTASESGRRLFLDTNALRAPGEGIFVYHYEPPEDDFTEEEHKIMVQQYRDQYTKKWGKLAEILYKEAGTIRTYKDCINHYYATKWNREYKGRIKGRRGGARRRGGAAARGRASVATTERPETYGEDGLPLSMTDSGRPKRAAAPTFGVESELDATTPTQTPGRPRRQVEGDTGAEKVGRRGKGNKEKGGRKPKGQQGQLLAVAPVGSPLKAERKEKGLGVKMEDDFGAKGQLTGMPMPMNPPGIGPEDPMLFQNDALALNAAISERPRASSNHRPGPSSYWSVMEQTDFRRNVAHFGTDWIAIANHMGTKTQTMVKNQYLRLVENGSAPDLEGMAQLADAKRERGEDLGPPPTPTPAPKRRYDTTQTSVPRTLAPTPEVAEMMKSPAMHPAMPPQASPPQPGSSARFPAIVQAPSQTKTLVPTPHVVPHQPTASEQQTAPPPSLMQPQAAQSPAERAPPPPSVSQVLSQPKTTHSGPLAGYFSDKLTSRIENRPPSQSSSIPSASARPPQQQLQTQSRAQQQVQEPPFRTPGQHEREVLGRDGPVENEYLARSRDRRYSQGMMGSRQYQPSAPDTSQLLPQMRVGAGSPDSQHESRPFSMQHTANVPPSRSSAPSTEVPGQPPRATVQQFASRSSAVTPPVKEESRSYPLPPHAPASLHHPSAHQGPQGPSGHHQAQPPSFSQPAAQPLVQPPPAATPKPAEPLRRSNILSLLNDSESEEPIRKKPSEQSVPSHTPTPQQQAPIAPPPSVAQSLPPRRDLNEHGSAQPTYSRTSYAQPLQNQGPPAPQVVDLTREQPSSSRSLPRESWQPRPVYHPAQGQPQQPATVNSPRGSISQPYIADRLIGSHRSVFAQHNAPRHNPSPPPHSAYSQSPHMHTRTPSLTQPVQPPRHGLNSATPTPLSQTAPGAAQILQPNPYAQVDPPGSGPQPSVSVGMRPSPHLHTNQLSQHRDAQNRNEHSQTHNANMSYSNPQTPNELHPAHHHMRAPSIADPYRSRDPREHEFDARSRERDVGREMSHRADALMRERDMINQSNHRSGPPAPSTHSDLRFGPPRSHTPLSAQEHHRHPSLQHAPHSVHVDNHLMHSQRQREDPTPPPHRLRESFVPPRDDIAERYREDYLARQERERGGRYREDYIRRTDPRLSSVPPPPGGPGGPGLGPHGHHGQHEQERPPSAMDWATAVRHPQGGWPRDDYGQR